MYFNIIICTTLCLKKVHTFKLCVTLSNLNRFSKFFALLKSMWNLLQNRYSITHLTLSMLLHYFGKLKSQIFCKYSTDMEKCKQIALSMQFVCIFPYLLNICKKFEFLISQGSVATCLRWGGYCCVHFVANFTSFPVVQIFWKSIKIWRSYREFKGGDFFWDTV